MSERYFCIHCEQADVERCDAEGCCTMCGVELVALEQIRATLSRAGLTLIGPEDAAVLEACGKLSDYAVKMMQTGNWCAWGQTVADAEAARRAAKAGTPEEGRGG